MRFDEIELDQHHGEFADEVQAFFTAHAGPEVFAVEERTGDGFNEPLHLAMGARGWIMDTWPRNDGGAELGRLEHRILSLGMERTGLPFVTLGTTRLVSEVVRRYAHEDMRSPLMLGAAQGKVRFCLGYTEPDGGSDVAAVRTRAKRHGSQWVVTGSKIFTTGAHNCQYAFTITRTNPNVRKHEGLTIFLIPLDAAGVEISPIYTFGGERTNIVHFDSVAVPDELRIGHVDGGWAILHDRLDAEHGMASGARDGLEPPSRLTHYGTLLARCVDVVHEWACAAMADGQPVVEQPDFRYQFGLVAAEAEAAMSAPGHVGRIKASQTLIDGSSMLLELLGPTAFRNDDTAAGAAARQVEFAHRYAQGTAIYGGTLEVFRNIIAHQDLKLPRPNYPN